MVGIKYLGTSLLSLLAFNPGALAHRWFNYQDDITREADGLFVPDDEADLVGFVRSTIPARP